MQRSRKARCRRHSLANLMTSLPVQTILRDSLSCFSEAPTAPCEGLPEPRVPDDPDRTGRLAYNHPTLKSSGQDLNECVLSSTVVAEITATAASHCIQWGY